MSNEMTADSPRWYVIQTNPRQEERSNSNLRAWQVETLAPKLKQRQVNQFTGKSSFITKPLFSRYIFARFKVSELLHKVRYTRGVSHIVSFGNVPIPVEDEVIDLLRSRICDDGFVRTQEELKHGDEVMIQSGPLKNFVGIFQHETNDSDRVMLLLKTVNYQAHIKIERELIKKTNS